MGITSNKAGNFPQVIIGTFSIEIPHIVVSYQQSRDANLENISELIHFLKEMENIYKFRDKLNLVSIDNAIRWK